MLAEEGDLEFEEIKEKMTIATTAITATSAKTKSGHLREGRSERSRDKIMSPVSAGAGIELLETIGADGGRVEEVEAKEEKMPEEVEAGEVAEVEGVVDEGMFDAGVVGEGAIDEDTIGEGVANDGSVDGDVGAGVSGVEAIGEEASEDEGVDDIGSGADGADGVSRFETEGEAEVGSGVKIGWLEEEFKSLLVGLLS